MDLLFVGNNARLKLSYGVGTLASQVITSGD